MRDPEARTPTRRGLVLAWMGTCPRCRGLGESLDYDVLLLPRPGFRRVWTAPLVYPVLLMRTLGHLVHRRPRRLVVVAPPFLLALVALPLARLLRGRVVIDIHSGALLDRRWRWSVPILRTLARLADGAVVTLASLTPSLRGARVLVLPDPLPHLSPSRAGQGGGIEDRRRPCVVAVCGWGDDEPLDALTAAARGAAWDLVLTGRPNRSLELPANVTCSGFLPEQSYVDLLAGADAVAVLTTREDTLLAGAWEGVALRRPLVLSGTRALRETFTAGAVFAVNTGSGLRAAIDEALARGPELSAASEAAAVRFIAESGAALGALREMLEGSRRGS